MAVYLIQAGDGGPVKIGLADDVPARFRDLQVANAAALTIIRTLAGGRFAEAWLHGRFASLRIRGEWFAFDPEMLTVDPPAAKPIPAEHRDLWAIIDGLGEAIGVSIQNRSKWRQRGVPHRYRLPIVRRAEADGVTIDRAAFDFRPARAEHAA